MAKIKLTLPGLEIPVDGKQVTFTAPCPCSAVDGIQIDGVDYDIVDSAGNVVPFGRDVWREGAVLTVVLDVTNRKAYLQNQNAYTTYETLTTATAELFGLGADAVPDEVLALVPGLIEGRAQIATGSYTGTGTYGASNPISLSLGFTPKYIVIYTIDIGNFSNTPLRFWMTEDCFGAAAVNSVYNESAHEFSSSSIIILSEWGETVTFYDRNGTNMYYFPNKSGVKYKYIAIG